METYSVIGKGIRDVNFLQKAKGVAVYTNDIKLPGMLYGKIMRSTYPHARIVSIDTSRAKRVAGVKAVITGEDITPTRFGNIIKDSQVFAADKVRYIGDSIAGIVATDTDAAEEAADLIRVEYQELPAVFDPVAAMKPDAPLLHEKLGEYRKTAQARPVPDTNIASQIKLRRGDVEAGFQQADFIFEDEFKIPPIHTCCLEPIVCVAEVDATGKITIWSSTQVPYIIRDDVAEYFGLAYNKVRVIAPFIGGGFGGKTYIKGELACAIMSQFTGKPVKLLYTREEMFTSGGVRHPLVINIKTGVNRDGKIVARHCREIWDAGAYADGGDAYTVGNKGGQLGRDGFQDNSKDSSLFQSLGVFKQSGSGFWGFTLHLKTTKLVD